MGLTLRESDWMLGDNIGFSKANDSMPFSQLPLKEQEERIENYKAKNYIDEKKMSPEEIRQACEKQYNEQIESEKNAYKIDNSLLNNGKTGSSESNLVMDAAALCQLTYCCDPNRSGDNYYHTASQNWFPYIIDKKGFLSESATKMFHELKKEPLLQHYDKYERRSLLQNIGGGTFRGIFGMKINLRKELESRLSRKRTGFFSMLYYRKGTSGTQLAYVPAGTTFNYKKKKYDLIMDNVIANGGQGLTGMSPQHTLCIQNAKILNEICQERGWELFFFGHSLGGGLAIASGLATGRKTIVFNDAGLNVFRNISHASFLRKQNIYCFFTDHDFLSTEKENKGKLKLLWKTFTPQIVGKRIYLGKGGHGIDGICQEFGLQIFRESKQIINGI